MTFLHLFICPIASHGWKYLKKIQSITRHGWTIMGEVNYEQSTHTICEYWLGWARWFKKQSMPIICGIWLGWLKWNRNDLCILFVAFEKDEWAKSKTIYTCKHEQSTFKNICKGIIRFILKLEMAFIWMWILKAQEMFQPFETNKLVELLKLKQAS